MLMRSWCRAIVNVVSYTCAFPAQVKSNVCCEDLLNFKADCFLFDVGQVVYSRGFKGFSQETAEAGNGASRICGL